MGTTNTLYLPYRINTAMRFNFNTIFYVQYRSEEISPLEDSSAVLVDFNKVFIFSPISFCIMILIIPCIYVAAGVRVVSFLLLCLRVLDIYIGCWIYIIYNIYWWYEIFLCTHISSWLKKPTCAGALIVQAQALYALGNFEHALVWQSTHFWDALGRVLHRWLSTERAGRRDFSCQRGRRSRWTRDFHEK